ncbi:hypothetical protein PM082_004325 [Marasmius tenuissimus]|nr:hypothetical protein PM082_004325 [Marasmius tenuissimus]
MGKGLLCFAARARNRSTKNVGGGAVPNRPGLPEAIIGRRTLIFNLVRKTSRGTFPRHLWHRGNSLSQSTFEDMAYERSIVCRFETGLWSTLNASCRRASTEGGQMERQYVLVLTPTISRKPLTLNTTHLTRSRTTTSYTSTFATLWLCTTCKSNNPFQLGDPCCILGALWLDSCSGGSSSLSTGACEVVASWLSRSSLVDIRFIRPRTSQVAAAHGPIVDRLLDELHRSPGLP